jgi:hypothetical protein
LSSSTVALQPFPDFDGKTRRGSVVVIPVQLAVGFLALCSGTSGRSGPGFVAVVPAIKAATLSEINAADCPAPSMVATLIVEDTTAVGTPAKAPDTVASFP